VLSRHDEEVTLERFLIYNKDYEYIDSDKNVDVSEFNKSTLCVGSLSVGSLGPGSLAAGSLSAGSVSIRASVCHGRFQTAAELGDRTPNTSCSRWREMLCKGNQHVVACLVIIEVPGLVDEGGNPTEVLSASFSGPIYGRTSHSSSPTVGQTQYQADRHNQDA